MRDMRQSSQIRTVLGPNYCDLQFRYLGPSSSVGGGKTHVIKFPFDPADKAKILHVSLKYHNW